MAVSETERELKVVAFPTRLYDLVRDSTKDAQTTNRLLIRDAVCNHIAVVESGLAELGFAPPEGKARKIVRTSYDPKTLATLREVAERTGVDASTLTMICLRRYLKVRTVDPGHKKLVAGSKSKQKPTKRKTKKSSS